MKVDNYIMNKTNFNKVFASFSFTIKSEAEKNDNTVNIKCFSSLSNLSEFQSLISSIHKQTHTVGERKTSK
jgi:O-acetylhomoserine/O-acetylserine sulfhydrylase-like pyridoxal-dependent enzyme